VCVNCASTDLWGAWVGDHPGLPGNPWRVYEVNHANLISESLRSLKGIALDS
jgi:hypothetical protein